MNAYIRLEGTVRHSDHPPESQRCGLPSLAFNLNPEMIFLYDVDQGIVVNGDYLNNIIIFDPSILSVVDIMERF